MVRRKIEIKLIEDDAKRHTTFTKRRKGLEKKTKELCHLCDAEGAIIVFSRAGNVYACGNPAVNVIVDRYLALAEDNGGEDRVHGDADEEEAAPPLTEMEKMIVEAIEGGRLAWEATVRNLGLSELAELESLVEEAKRKVAARAREVVASGRGDIPDGGI
ncbi:MADS box transcription factor [Handroanthus impetiginosus]|uniref:MADS box transcription factor n=1 Tax=Handroanthus impetiginosus TaxID=429701 RepID=A0A2G9HGU9_9LAMI|nr:MADS box transcription factor [Handroanthus impetiginosus]